MILLRRYRPPQHVVLLLLLSIVCCRRIRPAIAFTNRNACRNTSRARKARHRYDARAAFRVARRRWRLERPQRRAVETDRRGIESPIRISVNTITIPKGFSERSSGMRSMRRLPRSRSPRRSEARFDSFASLFRGRAWDCSTHRSTRRHGWLPYPASLTWQVLLRQSAICSGCWC